MTEPQVVLKQVRVKRAPHRYLEDGKYDKKPLDPNFFNNYYHSHKEPHTCEHCSNVFVCKSGLSKHLRRSNLCMRIRSAKTD